MAKFIVGDIVIVIYSDHHKYLIGQEATIISEPEEIHGNGENWIGVRTDLMTKDNVYFCPPESYLKKKPFKGEEEIMKLFTSLNNSGKIESDKLIEKEIV